MKTRQQYLQSLTEANSAIVEIRSKYAGAPGDMPGDAAERLERAMDDMLDARSAIEKLDKVEATQSWMANPATDSPALVGRGRKEAPAGIAEFRDYLKTGDPALLARNVQQTLELRSNNTQLGTIGGYVVPTEVMDIIKPDEFPTFMRQISRVEAVNALIAVPTLVSRPTAYWQGEVATATNSDEVFGQRGFAPNRLTIKSTLSRLLVQMGAIDVATSLMADIDYQRRNKEETAFLQGTGVGQPLGVFVANANGIPTSQDVVTAGASIASDDMFEMYYGLPETYRSRAVWTGSRAWVKTLAKLKDSNNQYIWSLAPAIPSTLVVPPAGMLIGKPVYESEFAPSTLAAGTYASVFGDFRHYRIFDFLTLGIEVLTGDPYASTAEIGYVCHQFVDGNVDLATAFVRQQVKP